MEFTNFDNTEQFSTIQLNSAFLNSAYSALLSSAHSALLSSAHSAFLNSAYSAFLNSVHSAFLSSAHPVLFSLDQFSTVHYLVQLNALNSKTKLVSFTIIQ